MADRFLSGLRASTYLLWGILLLVIWELLVVALGLPEYTLPAPHKVIVDLFKHFDFILRESLYTYGAAISGFLIGMILAFVLARLLSTSELVEQAVFPYFVASQAIPIMAFSVVIVAIFGNGWLTEVVIAVYLVFVPTTVNWVRGFKSSDPDAVAMMQSLGAGTDEIFWKLRVFDALPFGFSAAKVCAVVALAGAIVGEFVGAPHGIGVMLLRSIYYQDAVRLWAVIGVCAILGSGSYHALAYLERRVIWWKMGGQMRAKVSLGSLENMSNSGEGQREPLATRDALGIAEIQEDGAYER